MKKGMFFLAIVYLLCSFSHPFKKEGFNYDKKTGNVYNGTVHLFTMKEVNCRLHCDYRVLNTSGKELIYIRYVDFSHPIYKTEYNKSGWDGYAEILFYNTKEISEISSKGIKGQAKMIYEAGLIVNGEIDTVVQKDFIWKTGKPYTKKHSVLNNTSNLIIIDENKIPVIQNGVDVRIGNK